MPVNEPIVNLEVASPPEIDAKLAEIWGRFYAVQDKADLQRRYRDDYVTRMAQVDAGTYRWAYTDHDRARDEAGAARVNEKIAALVAEGEAILAEADPYEAEFNRRGGWTRAFLVTNAGGHVHRTRACSTCFPTTRFAWLTDLSGHNEAEIVELAGSAACTTCYPSAPVDVLRRPTRLEDPAVTAKREERERAKAARDAAKAAKAIANPDGSDIRLQTYGHIRTERTAEITYVDLGVSVTAACRTGFGAHMVPEYEAAMQILLVALAHKRGVDADELAKTLAVKIAKKYKREYA